MFASVLDPLYQLMAAILAAIYSVIPNYAVAIFGLTCIVLAILTPLTLKGLRSTIKIQKLMPEQKRLQAQFKDDRQALNEAIMAMYKENKVSPVGGCLPFIVQSPFFIALFGVLQGMSRVKYWVPTGQPFVEAQATGKVKGKIPEGAVPIGLPKHLPTGSSLYNSLFGAENEIPGSGLPVLNHAPGEVKALGFDLARSAAEMASKGFVSFLPYLALIVLMVGLQVFAQRQINRRNPAAAAANPQMQTITKVMPFMFGIFGWGFQAGLTLYWTTSSALRIVQQWALYRFDPTLAESVKEKRADLAREAAGGKKADKPAKGAAKPSGGRSKAGKPGSGKAGKPGPERPVRAGKPGPERSGGAGKPGPERGGKGEKSGKGAAPTGGGKGGPAGKGNVLKPAKTAEPAEAASGNGAPKQDRSPSPAAKPATAGSTPAGNGKGDGPGAVDGPKTATNGSGASPARPNPGRQQPKKRRKGR